MKTSNTKETKKGANELTEALFYDNVKAIKQLYLQKKKLVT